MAEAVDYWLNGNVEGVPVSWRSVVEALKSSGETGLAKRIEKKYCQQQDNVGGKGQTLLNVFMNEISKVFYVADSSCADSVSSVTVSSSNAITSSGNNYNLFINFNLFKYVRTYSYVH